MNKEQPVIEFINVEKYYPDSPVALSCLSFRLYPGEMVFLTGSTGAGKTTVCKLLLAMEKPQSGQILFEQQPIHNLATRDIPLHRRRIGIITQKPVLLSQQTVYDNVALPLLITGMKQQRMMEPVEIALERVGLKGKEHMYPHNLSLLEQLKVTIARAIVNNPKLLLADEPACDFDSMAASELINLFESIAATGISTLITSHDLALVAHYPSRILMLNRGCLTYDSSGLQQAS